jgi:hypothetical protein
MMLGAIIAILGVFLLGYMLGKHQGKVAGYQEGMAAKSLELRQNSLEHGYCVLCHATEPVIKETEIINERNN